jgi:hypothetical protein
MQEAKEAKLLTEGGATKEGYQRNPDMSYNQGSAWIMNQMDIHGYESDWIGSGNEKNGSGNEKTGLGKTFA